MKWHTNLDIFDIPKIASQFLKAATHRFIASDHCRKSKCLFSALFLFFGRIFSITICLLYHAFNHIHDHLVELCGVFRCNDRLPSIRLNGLPGLTCNPAAAPGDLHRIQSLLSARIFRTLQKRPQRLAPVLDCSNSGGGLELTLQACHFHQILHHVLSN